MNVRPFTWLALSYFGYYCAYGVLVPFLPVWLKSQNYGTELIGAVIASSYLFRFLGGIFFPSRVKRANQILPALRLLAWANVFVITAMAFVSESFWLIFIAIAVFSMVNAAGMPLTDSMATTWQRQIRLDYGKARLIGSAAFVVGVTVFGSLIGAIGEQYIISILIGLFGLYAVLQMVPPQPKPADEDKNLAKSAVGFGELLKNPTHLRLIIAAMLIQGSHAGYYVYSVIYWTNRGIAVETTSLLWGLGVIAEILLFFFSGRLFRNWSVNAIFYLSAAAAALRWGAFSYTDALWQIALLQCLHSLTFAALHYAMVRYIGMQPQNAMVRLQSLYSGLASCASVALLTALAGIIYPISSHWVFLVMMICALIALFVIPRKPTNA
ncbi:3-phenylpropionate MFS transporter [Basfia succiniciproducens]|uniref:3-phenylpropionate MFS transporter n=1 Tax=Basfia succiniciproducens TaxID=653940 RepID=UPI003FCEA0E4